MRIYIYVCVFLHFVHLGFIHMCINPYCSSSATTILGYKVDYFPLCASTLQKIASYNHTHMQKPDWIHIACY